jgi:two-component SAPR family response regulator
VRAVPEPDRPVAELRLLGGAELLVDGRRIAFDTRKAIAVLAYLAVTGRPQPRDALAALLWPERDQRHGRAMLRYSLAALRAALDASGVEVENAEVAQRPKTLVPLDEEGATRLMRLIDALEEQDDVDAVHANFDVPADVLERVAG